MDTTSLIIIGLILITNVFLLIKFFSSKQDQVNQTFTQVIERLARIDEAQKNIELLGTNVLNLQNVLTDKKTRGIFGEIQLKQILVNIFGESEGKTYQLQKMLSNQKIVDAMLMLPEPMGNIAVDSKFPLENYRRMVDQELSHSERDNAKKEFSRNVKKHVDDIAAKYIISGETAKQAVMFIPAEAIFAEIHAYHSDIVDYASRKSVWISSPTTLMAILTTVQAVVSNMERNENMTHIHSEINKLGTDFIRYQERWDDLSRHISTINKDVEKLNISADKLGKRFQSIVNLESVD